MRKTEAAWLAGIVEGDGSLNINQNAKKHKRQYLQIEVDMSGADSKDVIERVAVLFGVKMGGPYGPYAVAFSKKPRYRAAVCGRAALRVLRAIYPWLGERRRAQSKDILGRLTSISQSA